jgi:hypothetical protein
MSHVHRPPFCKRVQSLQMMVLQLSPRPTLTVNLFPRPQQRWAALLLLVTLSSVPVTTPFELSLSSSTLQADGLRTCAFRNRCPAAENRRPAASLKVSMSGQGEEGKKQNPLRGTTKVNAGTIKVDRRKYDPASDFASTTSEPEFRSLMQKL